MSSRSSKSPKSHREPEVPEPEVAERTPAAAAEPQFVAYSPQLPADEDLPHFAPKGPTVREFFTALGSYRPPSQDGSSITAHAASAELTTPSDYPLATDAFSNLFADSAVSEEDSRAAFALSGALGAPEPASAPTSAAAPPAPAAPQSIIRRSGVRGRHSTIQGVAGRARRLVKIAVINGPNLNLLGMREPELYGSTTLAQIEQHLREVGAELGAELQFAQLNGEGEIVEHVHALRGKVDGALVNAGAYSHTVTCDSGTPWRVSRCHSSKFT